MLNLSPSAHSAHVIGAVVLLLASEASTPTLNVASYLCMALPLRQGRSATCSVQLVYLDDDVRVVEDKTGDLFVYTRPVVSRP